MRDRDVILSNLEDVYRRAYDRARDAGREDEMADLDHRFQRDQLLLEAVLDVRDLLAAAPAPGEEDDGGGGGSLLEKAEALRRLTRLR